MTRRVLTVDMAIIEMTTHEPHGISATPATAGGLDGALLEEQDLVRRVSGGDARAFATLVDRYMRRAYYAALALVGSHEDALDLSQDAFARAYNARDRLDPERPFYPWFYAILRRLCFNHNRDRRSRRTKLQNAADWLVTQAADRTTRDPSKLLEREETIRRVREAMEALADREREVLVLKEFEGLRYREIAELLEIPIGTVMSRLYTARKRLAAVLEQEAK
ncbi:hypothetical protein ABI59_10880 [Acidobacteria bacterium Mor1]|nr:hypothetical protein ABI59_10880 [Acidobacteria bacterium Mor1]